MDINDDLYYLKVDQEYDDIKDLQANAFGQIYDVDSNIIEFDKLRNAFPIYNEEIFNDFIEEIFNEFASKESGGTLYISPQRFNNFIKNIPITVAERLYNTLCPKKNSKLYLRDFQQGFYILRYGKYEEVLKFIFQFLDGDRDGQINTKEIKQLLLFLPLKDQDEKRQYKYQMQSIKDLEDLILKTFGNRKNMIYLDEFKKAIDENPELFLLIFCYLYINIPVFDRNLNIYKKKVTSRRGSSNLSANSDGMNLSPCNKKFVLSPCMFSPISHLKNMAEKLSISPDKTNRKISYNDIKHRSLESIFNSKNSTNNTPITNSLKEYGAVRKTSHKSENTCNVSSNDDCVEYLNLDDDGPKPIIGILKIFK